MTPFADLRVSKHFRRSLFVFGMACIFAAGTVWACSTPVYRYAMYRWEPAPYEIYYFHEQQVDEATAAVHDGIRAAARCEDRTANLFLATVDVQEDQELKTVPPDVRKWWEARPEKQTPCYLVVTPYGVPIHHGDMDAEILQTLIDSPARRAVVEQLTEGHAGVMVMVTGSDDQANQTAETLIKEFAADIASGKIELYIPPPSGFFVPRRDEDAEEDAPESPRIEVGFVRVDRTDPQEKWFLEALLSMEEDLKDEQFEDQPMMFVIFGRGRALPPCIGRGINRDNLLDCIDFVTGACSCTVKEQNPGMDLLFATNWFVAAERLAARYGAEEGAEFQFSAEDMFQDLMIPPVQQASLEQPESDADGRTADAAAGDDPAVSSTDPLAQQQDAPADAQPDDSGVPIDLDEDASVAVAAVTLGTEPATATAPSSVGDPSGTFRGVFLVAMGLAAAFVLLFGMTFMVLRPR